MSYITTMEAGVTRLFCFPYAGGGSQIFRDWQAPKGMEIFPIRLPGRGLRLKDPPFVRLGSLVREIANDLPRDLPFAFFGHSLGALIAFELTRELRRRELSGPTQLFVSAYAAPHKKHRDFSLSHLPTREFLEELRRLGGTPPEALEHPELMEILIPVFRADFELVETYKYQEEPPLKCPISAFGGIHDLDINRSDMEAWRDLTYGPFSLSMFPGGHFFLHQEKSRLLRRITQKILQTS